MIKTQFIKFNKFANIVKADLKQWCILLSLPQNFKSYIKILLKKPAYRRLLDYRIKNSHLIFLQILRPLTFLTSLHLNLLILSDNKTKGIDSGLFFVHGFSTIIYCKSMGHNCKVYQQVTIGNKNGIPTIGNDVEICAGAKIIGPINIGDDVIIGANAVVTTNIPSHSVVVGIPGKIIKIRKSKEEPWILLTNVNVN